MYKLNIKNIILLSFTIVIPLQLLFTFFTNLVALPFSIFEIRLWETMVQLFFTVITFSLIQLPFAILFQLDIQDEEYKVGNIYGLSLQKGFMIYVLSILSAVIIFAGTILFIVPGIILMIFLIAIPQATVIENKTWWKAVKRSMKFAKQNFTKLFMLILIFMLFDFLVSYVSYFLALFTSNSFIVLNVFIMVGNAIILPFFIFTISNLYHDWIHGSEDEIHSKNIGDFRRKPIY